MNKCPDCGKLPKWGNWIGNIGPYCDVCFFKKISVTPNDVEAIKYYQEREFGKEK